MNDSELEVVVNAAHEVVRAYALYGAHYAVGLSPLERIPYRTHLLDAARFVLDGDARWSSSLTRSSYPVGSYDVFANAVRLIAGRPLVPAPTPTPTPDPGHPHLVGGEFQSDKYPTCPRGKVPLSTKDATAQDLLWRYAQRHRKVDAAFADDLQTALKNHGYVPDETVFVEVSKDAVAVEAIASKTARVAGDDLFKYVTRGAYEAARAYADGYSESCPRWESVSDQASMQKIVGAALKGDAGWLELPPCVSRRAVSVFAQVARILADGPVAAPSEWLRERVDILKKSVQLERELDALRERADLLRTAVLSGAAALEAAAKAMHECQYFPAGPEGTALTIATALRAQALSARSVTS